MEHKKSRWHKKWVGGTKKESVEQNQSRPGTFKESVPYHPGPVSHEGLVHLTFTIYLFTQDVVLSSLVTFIV